MWADQTNTFPIDQTTSTLVITVIFIWSLTWKGIALWKAAKNKSKPWFITIFLLNTLGILPIIYLILDHYKRSNKNNKNAIKSAAYDATNSVADIADSATNL